MSRNAATVLIHIYPEAPRKPALGAPCNGCGVCCLVEPCPLGALLSLRTRGACRVLRWNGSEQRYMCGAVVEPVNAWPRCLRWVAPILARWTKRWIAAGQGCDATLLTMDASPPRF